MNKITPKGLEQFLAEDSGLTEKITYEEFENKKAAPDNTDVPIAEAYQTYCELMENLK